MAKAMSSKAIRAAREKERKLRVDKKRRGDLRSQHLNYLIVCEGEKTEPNYFKAIVETRNSSVISVDLEGIGSSTVKLVKEAIRLRDKDKNKYDRVWAVFDKDDFHDFNKAIELANQNNIKTAWSNEAFELWYVLHFQYLDTAISRKRYIEIINRYFRAFIPTFKYEKNSTDFYHILKKYCNEDQAISNAKRLVSNYTDYNFSSHHPCTMVYNLIEELRHPEDVLKCLRNCSDAEEYI